jgi:tryptophan-rich sensory protein
MLLWTACSIFSLTVIVKNDLSASYFSYKDEYWNVFYEKPFSRVPAYLIGLIWGCCYFSYKHEQSDEELIRS